jgi:hypothetical protein
MANAIQSVTLRLSVFFSLFGLSQFGLLHFGHTLGRSPFCAITTHVRTGTGSREAKHPLSGYSSKKNLQAVADAGGVPYIAFKRNTVSSEVAAQKSASGALWQKMWHLYSFNSEEYLDHYHKRSNVETVFSMIKAKFGDAIRSRTKTAQINEALLKVLCHNICVLIQSFFELGIDPKFLPM